MWSPLNLSVPTAVWLDGAHRDAFEFEGYSSDIKIWNDRSGNGHYFEQLDASGDTPSQPAFLEDTYYGMTTTLFSQTTGEHMSSHRLVPQMQVGTGDFLVAALIVNMYNGDTEYQQIIQQKTYTEAGSGSAGILLRKYKNNATDLNTTKGQVSSQKVTLMVGEEDVLDYTMQICVFYRKNGYMYGRVNGNAIESLDLLGTPIDVNDNRDAGYHAANSTSPAKISLGNLGDTQDDNKVWSGSLYEAILVGDTVDDDDIYRIEGYLAHKYHKDATASDPFNRYTDGGIWSSFTGQAEVLDRLPSDHPYKVDMPAGWAGINTASGDNSLNGRTVGELSGDCGWLISDVLEVQRG